MALKKTRGFVSHGHVAAAKIASLAIAVKILAQTAEEKPRGCGVILYWVGREPATASSLRTSRVSHGRSGWTPGHPCQIYPGACPFNGGAQ